MRKYEVTLTVHHEKSFFVYADTREQAKEKTQLILCDTTLIDPMDTDSVHGEVTITDASEEDEE